LSIINIYKYINYIKFNRLIINYNLNNDLKL